LESGLKLEQVKQDCLYAGGEKKHGKQQHQYKVVMNGIQISSLT
jgi:hypothetical protein